MVYLMTRWYKDELAAHVQESHPHGQVTDDLDVLKKNTRDVLLRVHLELHGLDPWGRIVGREQPHGPEVAH